MQTDIIENGEPGHLKGRFWTIRKWFTFLVFLLLALAVVYLFTHIDKVHSGYQYSRFNAQQVSQINKILYTKDEYSTEETVITGVDTSGVYADSFATGKEDTIKRMVKVPIHYLTYTNRCNDSCRINNAMLYIKSEFDNKIKPDQLAVIRDYISAFNSQEVGTYLSDIRLRVQSYFWLTGPFVYLEVICWVLAGVICSILFTLGNAVRYNNSLSAAFNANEIPYQVAKFLYAPLCAIVVVFIYNYIKHRNVIEVNTNEGMIAFGFIAGLFSGRIMGILEKSKDLLLPENTFIQPINPARAKAEIIPPVIHAPVEEKEIPQAPSAENEEHITQAVPDYSHPFDELEAEIPEVSIDIKLDVSGLFEEERNEIINNGFDSAVVTLHSVNGRDIFAARKTSDSAPNMFVANHIRPGIYIMRTTLTQTLTNDYIINLFGEKTAYITRDNKNVELYIKKYEAID